MKKNNYLWTALAAATLTLAGCGGDDNGVTYRFRRYLSTRI